MDNNLSNIDEAFKNAFQHAEAPYNPAEMKADWSQVSAHLPASPATHAPSPKHLANHITGSVVKTLGITGGAAVIVTTAVILYNIYLKPSPVPVVKNLSATEQPKEISKPGSNGNMVQQPGHADQRGGKETNDRSTADNDLTTKPLHNNPEAGTSDNGDGNISMPHTNQPVLPMAINKANHEADKPANKTPDRQPEAKTLRLTLSDSLICVGQGVTATANTGSNIMIINWGDGYVQNFEGKAYHVYGKAGKFVIDLSSGNQSSAEALLIVSDKPHARFTAHQDDDLRYFFRNSSLQSGSFSWNFGDGSSEEHGYNAGHTYQDTGSYRVRLVAVNGSGCSDTFTENITVGEMSSPHVSTNIITPDGDHLNDDMYVITQTEIYNYQLTIIDATGRMVFQSSDKNQHWTGKNIFTGSDCMPGSYYYCIAYSYKQNGEPRIKRGNITLSR